MSVLLTIFQVWDLAAALDPRAPSGTLCVRTLVEHSGRVFRLQFDEFQIVSRWGNVLLISSSPKGSSPFQRHQKLRKNYKTVDVKIQNVPTQCNQSHPLGSILCEGKRAAHLIVSIIPFQLARRHHTHLGLSQLHNRTGTTSIPSLTFP